MNRRGKKTSTPLNDGKDIATLPFFKNISVVKNARKENMFFDTPSLLQFGTGKTSSRRAFKYEKKPKGPQKRKNIAKCDTPLRFKKSSLLSDKFSTKRLRFPSISHHSSNLSKERKYCGSSKDLFLLDCGKKSMSSDRRPNQMYSKIAKETKISSSSIGNKNTNSKAFDMEKENKNICENADGIYQELSSPVPLKDNLMKEKADLMHEDDDGGHSNEWNSNISDTSDTIESCRRSSCSSMTFWGVSYSLELDVLNDESFEIISCSSDASERGDSESFICVSNSDAGITETYAWEDENDAGTEIFFSNNIVRGSSRLSDIDFNTEHSKGSFCKDITEVNEFALMPGDENVANVVTNEECTLPNLDAICDKELKKNPTKEDRNKRAAHEACSTTYFSKNDSKTVIVSREVFKKPMPAPVCGVAKHAIRNKSLMNKIRKSDTLQVLKDSNVYPTTSTPFDSPEILKQDIPPVFKELSPIEKYTKKDGQGKWPLDDILITGIQAKRTYEKRKTLPRKLDKESQSWARFLKTASSFDCKAKNKVKDSMETSNCYLFESPPLNLPKIVQLDDIYALRCNSLQNRNKITNEKTTRRSKKDKKLAKNI